MKHLLLTRLIALTATVSSSAQTLQVDPMDVGGNATFNITYGAPLVAKHLRPVILVAPNTCTPVRRHHIEMVSGAIPPCLNCRISRFLPSGNVFSTA